MKKRIAYLLKMQGVVPAVLCCISLFSVKQSGAQEKKITEVRVSLSVKDRPLSEVLSLIESQTTYTFAYGTEIVREQRKISLEVSNMPLTELLGLLLNQTGLTYDIIGNQIVLHKMERPARITISGYVKDAGTGELLIGASIFMPGIQTGGFSNNYGFFSVTIPPSDSADMEISYVGYKTQYSRVSAHDNLSLSIGLAYNQQRERINSLIITNDKRAENVQKNQPALIDIASDMIVSAPSLNGSGDVVSSVEMLPGVQSGLDGTPGYCVRGGSTGQNLILLDEATLYNPSHVFGLVSIFNPPTVKNVSLMKGGFPAAYGDHVSSVLDIALKDGSKQQYGGVVQLGSVSSGITLYGPLQKDRSSFLVAARRSAIDFLLRPILAKHYLSNYYFYDINAKMDFQLSEKDRLYMSFYTGRDNNNYMADSTDTPGIDYTMHFGNTALSLRWNHVYSGKLFSNTSVVYNHYHQFLSVTHQDYFAQLYSGIRDINAKTDFTYYPSPAHKISAGINYLYQTLFPASVSEKVDPGSDSLNIDPGTIPKQNAARLAVYASDDIKLGRRVKLYIGVRAPAYYKPDVQYFNIEPRLSLLYKIGNNASLKASYTQMHQYIHLVQSYNASFPAEIWIGSSQLVMPQSSREVSAGIFKNFKDNIFQTSLEFYYKKMDNQLLFRGGTSPAINNNIEAQLIFGKGWSYGSECFIRKNRGRLTGWLAYSFAYAYQQFDSLNLGGSFPFAYDRRHTLYLSAAYAINTHWKASANFFIASGRAFTLKTSTTTTTNPDNNPLYDDEGSNGNPVSSTQIAENNYRLRPANRLDMGISYTKRWTTSRRPWEMEWILSVYNVYARKNTSFAYRTIDPATKEVLAKEVPFIPVIPSLTCIVRF
jgi:hypothetical protein